MERGIWKPHAEVTPTCPRCGSNNTKFCYYNNYSLTQPRYFCKGCRRYWTKGGSLRNVPVGGGCRKSRRGKTIRLPSDGVSNSGLVQRTGQDHDLSTTSVHRDNSGLRGSNIDGSNIDLAAVYANFLNQEPSETEPTSTNSHQLEITKFPSENNAQFAAGSSSYDFSAQIQDHVVHSNMDMHDLGRLSLPQENGGFLESLSLSDPLSEQENTALYYCGVESIDHQKQQLLITEPQFSSSVSQMNNYILPPLPGEEINNVASQSQGMMGWSNSEVILHQNQLGGLDQSEVQDPDHQLMFTHQSHFETIFRP